MRQDASHRKGEWKEGMNYTLTSELGSSSCKNLFDHEGIGLKWRVIVLQKNEYVPCPRFENATQHSSTGGHLRVLTTHTDLTILTTTTAQTLKTHNTYSICFHFCTHSIFHSFINSLCKCKFLLKWLIPHSSLQHFRLIYSFSSPKQGRNVATNCAVLNFKKKF